jgi:two-component system, NarL family, response regulator YdfI
LIRVAVIAPNRALRAGLGSLLSSNSQIELVGEAAELTEVLDLAPVMDVIVYVTASSLDAASPAKLLDGLTEDEIRPAILLLVDKPDEISLQDLSLPAWGLLPLDATPEELSAAVYALHEGLLVGAPHLMVGLFKSTRSSEAEQELGLLEGLYEPLTSRESEVLQLLAQGLANKQIAVSLGISEHTVKFHVSSIYSKLGASSRTEAVSIGARRGLVVL